MLAVALQRQIDAVEIMCGLARGGVVELLERGGQLAVIRAAVEAVAADRAVVIEGRS